MLCSVPSAPFNRVRKIGLTLPGVEAAIRYDGASILKMDGKFMCGIATHPSAEPGTLVVKFDIEERQLLLDDAPDVYYLTEYYRPYPVLLARLAQLDADALRDLLSVSRRVVQRQSARRR